MQLKRLVKITLKFSTKQKQLNGASISNYKKIKDYNIQRQDLTADEISTSIYGADVIKMYRISSPRNTLEKYLLPKVDNISDNISKYFIFVDDIPYKIISVKEKWVDISRL